MGCCGIENKTEPEVTTFSQMIVNGAISIFLLERMFWAVLVLHHLPISQLVSVSHYVIS